MANPFLRLHCLLIHGEEILNVMLPAHTESEIGNLHFWQAVRPCFYCLSLTKNEVARPISKFLSWFELSVQRAESPTAADSKANQREQERSTTPRCFFSLPEKKTTNFKFSPTLHQCRRSPLLCSSSQRLTGGSRTLGFMF